MLASGFHQIVSENIERITSLRVYWAVVLDSTYMNRDENITLASKYTEDL